MGHKKVKPPLKINYDLIKKTNIEQKGIYGFSQYYDANFNRPSKIKTTSDLKKYMQTTILENNCELISRLLIDPNFHVPDTKCVINTYSDFENLVIKYPNRFDKKIWIDIIENQLLLNLIY